MPRDTTIQVGCRICQNSYPVLVDESEYTAWIENNGLIQDYPGMMQLSAGERELLISNTCDSCWKNMFGQVSEEELQEEENDLMKQQVEELMDVLANGYYAVQHGDSDMLEAFEIGAKRVLKEAGKLEDDEEEEDETDDEEV